MRKGAANPILTIRLNDAENARFWRLMDVAKDRNAYAGKSDVLRELLGLNRPEVLTKDEIHFFRTGEKRPNILQTKKGTLLKMEVKLEPEKKPKVAVNKGEGGNL